MAQSRKKCCATCEHWRGFGADDVAACDALLPDAVLLLLEFEDIDLNTDIAGDKGTTCTCYQVSEAK